MATKREPAKPRSKGTPLPAEDTPASERVLRHEERLEVSKVPEEVGQVRVTKGVVETEESVDVPVMRMEVETTRRHADREASDQTSPYQEGDTFVIPVIEERLEVRKVPYVVEEILVRRKQTQETRTISATVRKEEVHVDAVGDLRSDPEPPDDEAD